MKVYHLSLVRLWLFIGLFLVSFAAVIAFIVWIAVPWIGMLITLSYFTGLTVLVWLNKIPTYRRAIELKSDGFYIRETQQVVSWEAIQWYRVDENSVLVEDFVVKIKGLWPLHFRVRPKGRSYAEWQAFKNKVISSVERLAVPPRNYYDTPFWRFAVVFLLATFPGVFGLIWWLGIPFREIVPGLLIYFGTTASMIATILLNIRQQE